MEDLLKKIIHSSIELVNATAEKIEKSVEEMMGKEDFGSSSSQEGESSTESTDKETDAKSEETGEKATGEKSKETKSDFESGFKEKLDNIFYSFKVPSQAEFEKLSKRIDQLEQKIEDLADRIIQHESKHKEGNNNDGKSSTKKKNKNSGKGKSKKK